VDELHTLVQLLIIAHGRSPGYADRTFVAYRFDEQRELQDQRVTPVTLLYFELEPLNFDDLLLRARQRLPYNEPSKQEGR
jgi:hypothetical protein